MAAVYRRLSNAQSQGTAQDASRQGLSTSTQRLRPGRPVSAINHYRVPFESSKSNMGDPPRSLSIMHHYPEQFYIDKNFDIDKALQYWGLRDSQIKLEGHSNEKETLVQAPSLFCSNRKPPNPQLKRAADLTDFIFNPDCPECRSAVWPPNQLPTDNPFRLGFHKSQGSWSTVSTEDTLDFSPDSTYSASSCALASRQRPSMYDQTTPGGTFSPAVPQSHAGLEDPPKMSHRLSRPAPSLPQDEFFVFPQPSPGDSNLCPDCSPTPLSNRGRQLESPSRPGPHAVPVQSSVSPNHTPHASGDTSPELSAARSNDRDVRFSPSRPAPKLTGQQPAPGSVSRPQSSRKIAQQTTSDFTQVSDELLPHCMQERSVWESDSDSEDDSKFRIGNLRKVKSKITLRKTARSTSRLSVAGEDAIPSLPTNVAHSFSKKNASTGSIQPVKGVLRKRDPRLRPPSSLPVSQPNEKDKDDICGAPTPDIKPRSKSLEKTSDISKSNTQEATRQATIRFYSCAQTQTDVNLILPHQKGFKQAWGAIRSRMKVLACNKVRNTTVNLTHPEESQKDLT